MKKRNKILLVVMLLLCVGLLSGCIKEDVVSISESNKYDGGTHWYNLINPDVIKVNIWDYNGIANAPSITSCGNTIILYEFTVDGLRNATEFISGMNHVLIDLPDRTMDIHGIFNDSIFIIDADNVTIRGQGHNIDSVDEYGNEIFERSETDSIFRVFNDSGDNCSVLKIIGDNCTVVGTQVNFMFNNSDMNAISMFGGYGSIISNCYVKETNFGGQG